MKFLKSVLLMFFLTLTLLSGCVKKEISENVTAKAEVDIEDDTVLDLCIYNADTLNPLVTSVKHNAEVLSCLYDSLFTISSNFDAEPQLCESYTFSEDGLLFTAHLRNNVFFQDGKLLTAQDAADSVMRLLSSDGYYKKRLHGISEAYAENNVLYLKLTEPNENLCMLLDFPVLPGGGIQDSSSVLTAPSPGSGLYMLKSYKMNHSITLAANRAHFSGKMPYFSDICIHMTNGEETAISMLENGEIDVLSLDAAKGEYTPKSDISSATYPSCRYVFVGAHSEALLSGVSNHLIQKNDLPDGAVSAAFPIHPSFKKQENSLMYSDKTQSAPVPSCTLLYCQTVPTRASTAEQIAESCAQAGWTVTPVGVPEDIFQQRIRRKDYDLYLGETELLPDFSFRLPGPTVGLYFVAESLWYREHITEVRVSTLNPYKSMHEWK